MKKLSGKRKSLKIMSELKFGSKTFDVIPKINPKDKISDGIDPEEETLDD